MVPFPFVDDPDTFKERPALVVQSDSLITEFEQRIMAQITGTPRIGASRVQVKKDSVEGKRMGLLTDSSLVLDKLVVLKDSEVVKVIGQCPPQTMALVDTALRATFDL